MRHRGVDDRPEEKTGSQFAKELDVKHAETRVKLATDEPVKDRLASVTAVGEYGLAGFQKRLEVDKEGQNK